MSGILKIVLILVGVVGVYILTYYFNQKTATPEGVEAEAKCETCHSMSCSLRTKGGPKNEDEENECEVKMLD